MFRKLVFSALMAGSLCLAGAAQAQGAAEKKAQDGIGGFMSVFAIAKVCNFTMDPTTQDVIGGNINALQPVAKITDQQLDAVLAELVDSFGKDKARYCGGGASVFPVVVGEIAKASMEGANGSGVALRTLPAPGQEFLVTANDITTIRTLAASFGEAEASKDSQGDPIIKGTVKGTPWRIFFYGCQKGFNCTAVQFYYGITTQTKLTAERINAWNVDNRFARAYLDKDKDPNISTDVELKGGVSRTSLQASMDRFLRQTTEFKDFVAKK